MKSPTVYIMASARNGTLYTGVTSNITQRVYEHKNSLKGAFSKKYDCKLFVYYEVHETMESAIIAEKKIKGGSRKKKIDLIECQNPHWDDLYLSVFSNLSLK